MIAARYPATQRLHRRARRHDVHRADLDELNTRSFARLAFSLLAATRRGARKGGLPAATFTRSAARRG